jgi:[ribosomal protein S5]-alanine N-acetyltransferase
MAIFESTDLVRHTSAEPSRDDSPTTNKSSSSYPTLRTRRFRFRPFVLTDISPLTTLAGEHRVADTTIGVPHPYTAEFARMWISSHSAAWQRRRALHWAAVNVGDERIAGYAGLHHIDMERAQAELRFWVGCGVERTSDAVEWSAAIVEFALAELDMNRVYALQLDRHPLAGRVLSAIGMERESTIGPPPTPDGRTLTGPNLSARAGTRR